MATKRKALDYHTEPPKSIRGLDPILWERVKGESATQNTEAYRVLNQALREYLDYRDYLAAKDSVK